MSVAFSPWRVQPLLLVFVSSCVLVSLHLAHLSKEGKTITNLVQNSRSKPGKMLHQRNPAQQKRRAQGRRGITREEGCGLLHSLLDFCRILVSFSSSLLFACFFWSGGLRRFEEN